VTSGSGLLLARHGQTDDNLEPIRVQGFRDTPLNEVGRAQARDLAELIAERYDVGSLWCSDLSRASETAAIVGARIGLEPVRDARLREGFRGRWEGRLFIDIEREEPELYAAWRRGGAAWRFPEGESLAEHQARVLQALAEIRASVADPRRPALVVCHRGSIRVVLCADDPRGLDAFHSYDVPNAGVLER
jgi:broad specificity phosphatase PhoE